MYIAQDFESMPDEQVVKLAQEGGDGAALPPLPQSGVAAVRKSQGASTLPARKSTGRMSCFSQGLECVSKMPEPHFRVI